mmetsp:Transcript_9609/g.29772  ORF Transcript_9609/g.29772 Transcript_9609/m.29772 type:complete len:216 (+) Transcript_9609:31-678(+)
MRIHSFSPLRIGRLAATNTAMPSFAFVVFLSALFVGSFAQAVKGTQPPYDLANRDTRAVRKGRFDGKVCLVTGGTSGLGADAAVHLAAEGCKTVLTGRRAAMGDRVVKLITDAGGEATFVQADVSKEEDCKKMVDTTVAKYGKLDAAFKQRSHLGEERCASPRDVCRILSVCNGGERGWCLPLHEVRDSGHDEGWWRVYRELCLDLWPQWRSGHF